MGSELQRLVPSWSWEENKKFEVALAAVDHRDPRRWEAVAAILGGKRSVEEVQEHYVVLLQDLEVIESGCLDCELDEHGRRSGQLDEDQSLQIRCELYPGAKSYPETTRWSLFFKFLIRALKNAWKNIMDACNCCEFDFTVQSYHVQKTMS